MPFFTVILMSAAILMLKAYAEKQDGQSTSHEPSASNETFKKQDNYVTSTCTVTSVKVTNV